MGRYQRSKNSKKNMRNINKRSENYKTKAELKKERKQLKKEMMKKHLIGIYDSYRTDGKFNHVLNNNYCSLVGTYSSEPIYKLFDLGDVDDIVIKSNGNTSVKIEVWEVDESTLSKIERGYYYYEELEQIDQTYIKKEINSPFGSILIFMYNEFCDPKKEITNGDSIDYLNYKKVMGNKKENVL